MIKATDLMIGDWVLDISPVIIDAISNEDICTYRNKEGYITANPSNLKPIPLTPEMLEKNGWVKFHTYYRHFIDGSQYLEWYQHEGRLQRLYIHKDNSREVVFAVSGLSYMHQFQHALKLCGIDKDIRL